MCVGRCGFTVCGLRWWPIIVVVGGVGFGGEGLRIGDTHEHACAHSFGD